MKGPVNGVGINGTALPNWVVRAVVVAVAAATVNVEQTRTTFGSVNADASVVVTLTQTHTIAGRATATADCSHFVAPTVIYAGSSSTTATAFGAGAVRRDVYADAGGDATATGLAISADALGDAQASCTATVDVCDAHIIHPGRANVTCSAAQVVSAGDVTRYTGVTGALGSVDYTRAEANIKLNGESFYRLDGFVPSAQSTCTASLDPALITLTVTSVPVSQAQCLANARTFIRYPARASTTGIATYGQIQFSQRVHSAAANTTTEATGAASGVRGVRPTVLAVAESVAPPPRSLQRHAAAASASSEATSQPVSLLRTTYGRVTGVVASARLVSTAFGKQHFGVAANQSAASASPAPSWQEFAASASGASAATFNEIVFGTQHFAASTGQSEANANRPNVTVDYKTRASASGEATLVSSAFGVQQRAIAVVKADSTLRQAVAFVRYAGHATGFVTGSGQAIGFSNSDKRAPDERYMIVPQDVRAMVVFYDEREMRVAA